MKVLHIGTNAGGGGAAIAMRRHCEAMRRVGIDAKILALYGNEDNMTIVYPKKKWSTILLYCKQRVVNLFIKLIKKPGIMSWEDKNFDLSIIHEINDADIIYIHWINGFLSVSSIKYLLSQRKPIIWYMHDMWPITGGCHHSLNCSNYESDCTNCKRLRIFKQIPSLILKKKVDFLQGYDNLYLAAPSIWLTRCISQSAMFKGNKVFNIPNIIDTDFFKPMDKIICRNRYNIPNKKIVLFSAVHLGDIYKGAEYLIEVISRIEDSRVDFVVVGNCDLKIFPKKIRNRIHILGYLTSQHDMVQAYNVADVLLTTSMADNFPNVVIEAMACSIPVIGFATGGIKDQINHKVNGWITEQKNISGLLEGINWVLFDSNYSSLQKAARNYVIECCSYQNVEKIHAPLLNLVNK